MCGSKLLGEEETGGLDDYVDTKLAPSDVGRILLCEDLDLLAIDDKIVALSLDIATEMSMDGVMTGGLLTGVVTLAMLESPE